MGTALRSMVMVSLLSLLLLASLLQLGDSFSPEQDSCICRLLFQNSSCCRILHEALLGMVDADGTGKLFKARLLFVDRIAT